MIKQITKEQYWQLVGLLALAKNLSERLEDIVSSIQNTLQVKEFDCKVSGLGDPEHIRDAVYSGYSPEELLQKLDIINI